MTLGSSSKARNFRSSFRHLGIAVSSGEIEQSDDFVDLEEFFLWSTTALDRERSAEGILCWVSEYSHLLSPSKVRRLIKTGRHYDAQVLGGMLEFIFSLKNTGKRDWTILLEFAHKGPKKQFSQFRVRKPFPAFAKWNILIPSYVMNKDKFLRPKDFTLANCPELRHRAMFGSVVHADVVSYLSQNAKATAYEVAKQTGNHKARVFEIFDDVKAAMGL